MVSVRRNGPTLPSPEALGDSVTGKDEKAKANRGAPTPAVTGTGKLLPVDAIQAAPPSVLQAAARKPDTIRVAVTETMNAAPLPETPEKLSAFAEELKRHPLQLAHWLREVRRANVKHNIDLIIDAAKHGANVICLGEVFTAPYFGQSADAMWLGLAEDAQRGPTVKELSEVAKKHNIVIIAPIYEKSRDAKTHEKHYYNTAVVIEKDGTVLGQYRKSHIPTGANERGKFIEGFYYEPGQNAATTANNPAVTPESNTDYPVFETSVGNIGVVICYDRHFPAAWEAERQGKADIVFCPAITFGEASHNAWQAEGINASATKGYAVAASNRRGTEAPFKAGYFGETYITDTLGGIIAATASDPSYRSVGNHDQQANLSTNPELLIADVELAKSSGRTDALQSGWPLPASGREELGDVPFGAPAALERLKDIA